VAGIGRIGNGGHGAYRHRIRRERLLAGLERFETPRDRLLGVFDALAELTATSGFRGLRVLQRQRRVGRPGRRRRAGLEREPRQDPGPVHRLAGDAGVADPAALADQFMILYDGASVGARMYHEPGAAANARAVAECLLNAAPTR
jgi:hypothetical protein